jgi:ATP-dependent helicase HrpA
MHISYPPDLPISSRRDDIAEAIRDHQVVVLAGETGSGKTTQLPKICLELGRGRNAKIGHTQPRRLAARTVAARIAEELGTELGDVVGWKVRFTDQVGSNTKVKLMTDGILLAELTSDRMLRQYDTLIIDEAHERSLNIDFILGYLKRLLPRRPDLKLIITSATIDPERFAEHFAGPDGKPAPIIEVSGRTYPVEQRYRPVVDPDDPKAEERDQVEAIVDAVRELAAEGPGDVLVFLPGERDIRDTQDALADAVRAGQLTDLDILPLFARLSTADQQRVFAPHSRRRVVLATNVAETSLTVPGIKYVVDPGLARISRYSHRTKVQRLPIEKISQASAAQRAGRCGRTSDGICIRLYAEDDFDARPEFTDPEILRTNLASVVLRMIALGFGEVADFPFVDPPDRRAVTDGLNLLHELGALDGPGDGARRITEVGRAIERLPIEPRFARMLIEAGRNGCVAELLIIVSGMSIQDPRERPADATDAADQSHVRFADPRSDFVGYLNLWRYLETRREELTGNQFRRMCRAEYLHYLRIREWLDLHGQLRRVLRDLDIGANTEPADPRVVHQSLLAGLLSHIGLQVEPKPDPTRRRRPDRNAYLGARNASFAIFPGSALFRRPPRWVMAAELVETSRLWARTVARIEPEWIEPLATHLVKSTFSEPHWSAKRGAVMAHERVTLYGVPIVADRLVNYAGVDPELARELFIRHALVQGEWQTQHAFWTRNRALLDEVDQWEQRARRRDIMVDEQALFDFYDRRVPASVVSARHFDRWWSRVRQETPELLVLSLDDLVTGAGGVSESDYPSFWSTSTPGSGEPARLALHYEFEPGAATDGLSVDIPLAVLPSVAEDDFSWQVPGHRAELVTALIRGLRKDLRRNFVPVPDTVRAALSEMDPARGSLLDELGWVLRARHGVTVPREAWRPDQLPEYLRLTFRVVGGDGKVLASGKDLGELRQRLAGRTRAAVAATAPELERTGLTAWPAGAVPGGLPGGELPRQVRRDVGGHTVTGYPALVDAGSSVDVRVLSTPAEQRASMWTGTRRLLLLNVQSPVRQVQRTLGRGDALALSQGPHGSLEALMADCLDCAADAVLAAAGGPAWDAAGFAALTTTMSSGLTAALVDVVRAVITVLQASTAVASRLSEPAGAALADSVSDVRTQTAALVYPGFVTATGAPRLNDVARYLRAADRRLETLPREPTRDREWMDRVHEVDEAYQELRAAVADPDSPEVAEIRWMIEELRVSFYAQTLGTRYSVSEKRIHKAIDALLP